MILHQINQREFPALLPFRWQHERVGRRNAKKGERRPEKKTATIQRRRPLFPRYLFVGMQDWEHDWAYLQKNIPGLEEILRLRTSPEGVPYRLPVEEVTRMIHLSVAGLETVPMEGPKFRVGDRARFVKGHSFEGQVGPIVDASRVNGEVTVMMNLLGGLVPVRTKTKALEVA